MFHLWVDFVGNSIKKKITMQEKCGISFTPIFFESAEIQKRRANVRDEIEKYETKSQILYVLDWPASSGDFYWVK